MQEKFLGLTPPMGWNSWNTFTWNINDQLIRETADVMVNSGLKDAGYEYVVIDDCWSLKQVILAVLSMSSRMQRPLPPGVWTI